jgi:hypothetical protein
MGITLLVEALTKTGEESAVAAVAVGCPTPFLEAQTKTKSGTVGTVADFLFLDAGSSPA